LAGGGAKRRGMAMSVWHGVFGNIVARMMERAWRVSMAWDAAPHEQVAASKSAISQWASEYQQA